MHDPATVMSSVDSATPARKNFNANLKRLTALIRIMTRDLQGSLASLKTNVTKQIRTISKAERLPKCDKKAHHDAVSKLGHTVEKFSGELDDYLQARALVLYDWSAVMLVTFLEAYLEDGLVELATKNPMLLRAIGQFDSRRVFEIDSIEDLRLEVRRQWARGKLRPGGPRVWCEWFNKLGTTGVDKKSVIGVQHLWDTRNLIVHAQGVASAEYVKKYPTAQLRVGKCISVSNSQFKTWLDDVKGFVTSTEQLFSRYKT